MVLGRALLLHFEGLIVEVGGGDGYKVGELDELVRTACLVLIVSWLVVSIKAI